MARIGSVPAAPFVGDQFASLYLGTERVPTVPGRPATEDEEWDGGETTSLKVVPPASDGGSAIIGYKVYLDGDLPDPLAIVGNSWFFSGNYSDQTVQVSAVNAVGEGPRSFVAVVVDIT